MRELGFTKREAAAIASSGFKSLNSDPEPEPGGEQIAELLDALQRRGKAFN